MISTFGWIVIIFMLLILLAIYDIVRELRMYKPNKCYYRSVYKCANCRYINCKYHILARKINK